MVRKKLYLEGFWRWLEMNKGKFLFKSKRIEAMAHVQKYKNISKKWKLKPLNYNSMVSVSIFKFSLFGPKQPCLCSRDVFSIVDFEETIKITFLLNKFVKGSLFSNCSIF